MKRSVLFNNRKDAALLLSNKLEWLKREKKQQQPEKKQDKSESLPELCILSIPRGGIIIGDILASAIGGHLDVLLSEKIVAPYNIDVTIGAAVHDGSHFCIVDQQKEKQELQIPYGYIEEQISAMVKEMENRLIWFRGNSKYELNQKIVLLVDDGIATGATMFAAVQWIRKQNPKELIVAVPVAPRDIVDRLGQMADRVVVVLSTPFCYNDIGEFYYDFIDVNDRQVEDIMRKHLKDKDAMHVVN